MPPSDPTRPTPLTDRNLWGPLADRYLPSDRPHRLLALDGGGIRGVLTLAILAEIERQLAARTDRPEAFRLCHFFDYVGGTSTGAIIAAGLARGMSVQELMSFYVGIGPEMFQKERLLRRIRNLYRSDPLTEQLKHTFGASTTLAPDGLQCLLLVVTRNVTTDSPWPVSSAPTAKYNAASRPDSNLKMPLWQLVRASTAAPIYFPPEILEWEQGNADKSFVFVDGGMTPYNNPSFLLYRMATTPEYRLGWPRGESKLMLVSVGTGAAARRGADSLQPETNMVATLAGLPGALMGGAAVDQDVNCRVVGRCVYGDIIDREVGDLIPREDPTDPASSPVPLERDLGRHFLYARYNADLSEAGLDRLGITGVDAETAQKLDAVENIGDLTRIGQAAAKSVNLAQFGGLVPARLT